MVLEYYAEIKKIDLQKKISKRKCQEKTKKEEQKRDA